VSQATKITKEENVCQSNLLACHFTLVLNRNGDIFYNQRLIIYYLRHKKDNDYFKTVP